MLNVYNCLVHEHDLRLVALAAVICAVASFTAISLLHHVRKSAGQMRLVWLGVAAIATGFGIWSTHFVAMLAFSPGIPSGYGVALTALSLVTAVVVTGAGLALAVSSRLSGAPWLGGGIVGGGIAAMHYTGMAAFQIEGWIFWDALLVGVSIALGCTLGAVALWTGLRSSSGKAKLGGALLLTVAICSHHFTAMGAVSILPDPSVAVPSSALPSSWLALMVACASFAILLLSLGGIALDLRDRHKAVLEAERMRGLANAAVEGLVVCAGETIVTANNSFSSLAGCGIEQVVGQPLRKFIAEEAVRLKLAEKPNEAIEADLQQSGGATVPVELILQPIDFGGKPHRAIAVRDLRARKKAEQDIRFLAHHDALTGLPNRAAFAKKLEKEIEAALASGERLGVLCLDLDRFKEVNDLFGHATGDNLLQKVATKLSSALDERQMASRLGGDEFAIVAPGLSDPAVAGRIAENILESLRLDDDRSTEGALVSCSIGIAICPNDGTDRQALMSHADTALYRAKTEGRGTYRFFEAAMGAQVRDRRLIEHDLRHAVARRELSLVYQPQKNITTGEIVGFEALLRWNHKTRGDISPSVFIPIAEESGSILQIGEWVLRRACRDAAIWGRQLTLAVNVSPVQIHNVNFPRLVHEILVQTGLPPHQLELEITETALVRDLNRALLTLRQLKALGVRIAMDDFGTGYSSLSNLRAFPFDKIKIDGSFVKAVDSNEQTATIVRAVLGLGRGLGLPVLAEGVETSEELKFLASENCAEAQGYHLGRPAPIEEFDYVTDPKESPSTVTQLEEERKKRENIVRGSAKVTGVG